MKRPKTYSFMVNKLPVKGKIKSWLLERWKLVTGILVAVIILMFITHYNPIQQIKCVVSGGSYIPGFSAVADDAGVSFGVSFYCSCSEGRYSVGDFPSNTCSEITPEITTKCEALSTTCTWRTAAILNLNCSIDRYKGDLGDSCVCKTFENGDRLRRYKYSIEEVMGPPMSLVECSYRPK